MYAIGEGCCVTGVGGEKMTNEELQRWIDFGSDATDAVCPCCGRGKGVPQPGGGSVNYWEDISNCY